MSCSKEKWNGGNSPRGFISIPSLTFWIPDMVRGEGAANPRVGESSPALRAGWEGRPGAALQPQAPRTAVHSDRHGNPGFGGNSGYPGFPTLGISQPRSCE